VLLLRIAIDSLNLRNRQTIHFMLNCPGDSIRSHAQQKDLVENFRFASGNFRRVYFRELWFMIVFRDAFITYT